MGESVNELRDDTNYVVYSLNDKSTELALVPAKKPRYRLIPDYIIFIPAFLELDALLINTDEDDAEQWKKHFLTNYYFVDTDGNRVLTIPERGELGINIAKRLFHPPPLGSSSQRRHKLPDIIEIANLVKSKGGSFTVQRFAGKMLYDPEVRKQINEMLAKVYVGTLFLNAGYTNVTPGAAPQATPDILPGYVKGLIEAGYVKSDGKTALFSLNEVAAKASELIGATDGIKAGHLERFVKENGEPYSKSAIVHAVNYANIVK